MSKHDIVLTKRQQHIIARWLFTICAMIFIMVIIGGLTRLTDSGLSITEWKPIHGVVPPLSAEEWQEEFTLYKKYPEYQKVNKGMSLQNFKRIFWWEYAHRLWGRLIGLAFALPLLWFLVRWRLPDALKARLAGLFLLGGSQGALGWYMVQSGLVDRPDVSHFRLTAHLLLAFLVFSLCWMQALALRYPQGSTLDSRRWKLRPLGWLCLGWLFLTLTLGGFVAGLDAGLVYNTFPKMGDRWFPAELWHYQPWWQNVLHNHVTIQFFHRLAGIGLWVLTLMFWLKARRQKFVFWPFLLFCMTTLQVGLGIATLLSGVSIPLAALHQANAVVVLGITLTGMFRIYFPA